MLLHGASMASTHHTHHKRSKEAALPLPLCWLLRPKKKDTDSLSLEFGMRVNKGAKTARFIVGEGESCIFCYMFPFPLHIDTRFPDLI